MRALILIAHGSRREASNDEVRLLACTLAARIADRYPRVEAAFLELAEPSIPAAIDGAVAAGASEVVLLPYFLSAGRHLAEDIPSIAAERQAAHPGVTLRIAPYPGGHPAMLELLAGLV